MPEGSRGPVQEGPPWAQEGLWRVMSHSTGSEPSYQAGGASGTFWGLPTVGPFALKLLAWLELAGLPYEQVYEANPRKGPKGKNPWIELDGERIGDSEVIIDLLKERHAVQLDEGLTAEQLATGHAWRRTFEEHYHQVLEWELFFHPAGAAWMR